MVDSKLTPVLDALRRGDLKAAQDFVTGNRIRVAVDPTQRWCIDAVLENSTPEGLSFLIDQGVKLGVIKAHISGFDATIISKRWAAVRWLEAKGLVERKQSPYPSLQAWAAALHPGVEYDAVVLGQWSDAHTRASNFLSGLVMLIALPFAGAVKERKGGLIAVSRDCLYCFEVGSVMMPGLNFGVKSDLAVPLDDGRVDSWPLREVSVQLSEDGKATVLVCSGPTPREVVIPGGYRPFTSHSDSFCRLAAETGSGADAVATLISSRTS